MKVIRLNFKDFVMLCSKCNVNTDLILSMWKHGNIEEYIYVDSDDTYNNEEYNYRVIKDKEDLLKALIEDKWE